MEQNTIVIDKLTLDMVTHISKIRQMIINGLIMDMNIIHYVPNSITEKDMDILVEILRTFSESNIDNSNIDYTSRYIVIELTSTDEKSIKAINKFINNINNEAQISLKVNEYISNPKNLTNIDALHNLKNFDYSAFASANAINKVDPTTVS